MTVELERSAVSEQDHRFAKTIAAFREGLVRELEAQKQEARRSDLRAVHRETSESSEGRYRAGFAVEQAVEALVSGASGKLLSGDSEIDVKVAHVEGLEVVLTSAEALVPGEYRLSLSPWFLFEKLQEQLSSVESNALPWQREAGLRSFGVIASEAAEGPRVISEELNPGQTEAVQQALAHQAFRIWGPPGTGKTTTLAVLVSEMVARGERVLLTSNTHAALDQVLSGLRRREALQPLIAAGRVVRLGQCRSEHRDCSVREITHRQHEALRLRRESSQARLAEILERLAQLKGPMANLREQVGPQQQLSLFERREPEGLPRDWLVATFGIARGEAWSGLSSPTQFELLERHIRRLKSLRKAHSRRVAECRDQLAERQKQTVERGCVILSTLANLTTSPLTEGEVFDNVIVEEAGMALLPGFFLACCRATKRTIAVGDPRQLPSILISRDSYVHRTLGRNIFEVGEVPKAMLTEQYRMHPEIGDLVSQLAYEGQLQHGRAAEAFEEWTARDPVPGVALAGWDLRGASTCQKQPGGSRFNEESAAVCIKLARKAVEAGFEQVAIISPYRQQIRTLRKLITPDLEGRVECDTVHRYQGKERDVVIVDLVDSESLGPGTLLRNDSSGAGQLMNVAFSRARYKLFLVGELAYLCRQTPESFVGQAILYLAQRKRLIKVVKAG